MIITAVCKKDENVKEINRTTYLKKDEEYIISNSSKNENYVAVYGSASTVFEKPVIVLKEYFYIPEGKEYPDLYPVRLYPGGPVVCWAESKKKASEISEILGLGKIMLSHVMETAKALSKYSEVLDQLI